MRDRYTVVTAAEPQYLCRGTSRSPPRPRGSVEREQEGAVEVLAVDPDRSTRLVPLSSRDRTALRDLLFGGDRQSRDIAAGRDTPSPAARRVAETSGPWHLHQLDKRARRARRDTPR